MVPCTFTTHEIPLARALHIPERGECRIVGETEKLVEEGNIIRLRDFLRGVRRTRPIVVQGRPIWQILTKIIVECRHQRILLGGDLNANASGLRVGYAAFNAEHMKRVDELLTQFVTDTQGELMSPSTVSWRQGSKGAKLDHIGTWNLSHDSNTGSLGACWRSVRTEIPEGCKELDHPALAQRLSRTMILTQHELLLLLPQGLNAQSVVRVGEQVFRPVPLGQVDWLGGPQHDHARVGFLMAPQVLAHTRKYCSMAEGTTRIRLKDW